MRVATPTTSVRSYNSNAASVIPMAGSGGNTLHWPLTGNPGTHDPTLINENDAWWEFQIGAGIFGKVSHNGGRAGHRRHQRDRA